MSDDLGFLLGDAARLLRRSFDERARVMGVTRPQWRVLALLKRLAWWNVARIQQTAAVGAYI
jgi:hypothetical protein